MSKMQETMGVILVVTLVLNLMSAAVAAQVKLAGNQGSGTMDDSEDSLNRFVNDPSYRAGYERAAYDLYYGRAHDYSDHVYPSPAKKAIDLGLGRFRSGSSTANGLLALDSANFAGGPGRK